MKALKQPARDRLSMCSPRNASFVLAFIFGMICFSGLVSWIQLDLLGLPLLFFEPVVLLFWVWATKPTTARDLVSISKVKVTLFVCACAILTYLALLGVLETDLRNTFSSARPYFLAVLVLTFGRILRNLSDRELFSFFLGVVIGDLFSTLLDRDVLHQTVVASPVNLVGLYVFTSLAVQSQRISFILLAIFIATMLTFLSALRVVALTASISLVTTFFIISLQRGGWKRALRLLIAISPAPIVLVFLVNWYVENGAELFGNKAFYRIYYRLGAYFDGGGIHAAQDVNRISKFKDFLGEDGMPIWPQGFVMAGKNMIGSFNDFPFLYFTYTFGLFLGVGLLCLMIFLSLRALVRSVGRSLEKCELVSVALVPYFLTVLLFLNGRYMYIPYETVLFWSFAIFWFPRRSHAKLFSY